MDTLTPHNSTLDGEVTAEVAFEYAGKTDDAGNDIPDNVREVAAERIVQAAAQNRQWKDNVGGLPVADQLAIVGSPTIHVPDGYQKTEPEQPTPDLADAPPPDPSTAATVTPQSGPSFPQGGFPPSTPGV